MIKRKKSNLNKKAGTLGLLLLAAASSLMVLTLPNCAAKNMTINLDPESERFYQEAHFLFTRQENQIFSRLSSPEDRKRFIQYFWDIRNPNPYTDENEFKLMMDDRFAYVNSYLKEGNTPGWKTDRGRIYMLLGPPDYVDSRPVFDNPDVHSYMLWGYGDQTFLDSETRYNGNGLYILFVDNDGHGRFYINLEGIDVNLGGGDYMYMAGTDMRLLDEAEKMKYKHITKKENLFEKNNLAFRLNYDENRENFHIAILPKNVNFDENPDTGMMTAKFKIDMVIYEGNQNFYKHTEVKTIDVKKEELLATQKEQTPSDSPLQLDIPLKLNPGPTTVDVFISDMLGDAGHRNLFTFNIKKAK
jgi:GWxTD domain-containing protein